MYPELEVFLYRLGEAEYRAVMRVRFAETSEDLLFEPDPVRIDTRAFDVLLGDPAGYGLLLGRTLFADPKARAAFDKAAGLAAGADRPLRVRLCTDQRSLKLHRLRWETLRVPDPADPADPARSHWLGGDARYLFSRHLFGGDMRPVKLRPQSDLVALVAVANPTDLAKYAPGGAPLAAIDVDAEAALADAGLGPIAKRRLTPEPGGPRVTLPRLLEAIGQEADILYLVCHGALVDGEPRLVLERDDGTAHFASGLDLVRAFQALRTLPRLVVLVSCQSGGEAGAAGGDPAALTAIGPRLAEAGVPAVLAMQGNLRMDTARAFFPPFFAALQKTGRVDEAAAAGRAAAALQPDAWAPVLYTRLAEGRVWYTRGLRSAAGQAAEFSAWKQLAIQIYNKKCVPILGPGVLDPFVGTTWELARRLAVQFGYPLTFGRGEDLPQIAQYIETTRGPASPAVPVPVLAAMAAAVRDRYRRPDEVVNELAPQESLGPWLAEAWRAYTAGRPFEPHTYLASKKEFRKFVTTNPDDLLKTALAAAGRKPASNVCRWTADDADDADDDDRPAGGAAGDPPAEEIFHLMGHLDDPDSLVLTEDDYFRFLTAVTRRESQKKDIRRAADVADDRLRAALASSALLFLGFRATDWSFRTLCRLLLEQKGGNMRKGRTHIAVQIDPEDGTHDNPHAARQFIVKLFEGLLGSNQVAVYWGGTEEFLEDLDKQWTQLQPR